MSKSEIADFGRHLRTLRRAKKFTQEELAYRAGLHKKFIGEVERGESNLKLGSMFKLAMGVLSL